MQYKKKHPFYLVKFSSTKVYYIQDYKKHEVERWNLISLYLCQWVSEPHFCQVSVLLEFYDVSGINLWQFHIKISRTVHANAVSTRSNINPPLSLWSLIRSQRWESVDTSVSRPASGVNTRNQMSPWRDNEANTGAPKP